MTQLPLSQRTHNSSKPLLGINLKTPTSKLLRLWEDGISLHLSTLKFSVPRLTELNLSPLLLPLLKQTDSMVLISIGNIHALNQDQIQLKSLAGASNPLKIMVVTVHLNNTNTEYVQELAMMPKTQPTSSKNSKPLTQASIFLWLPLPTPTPLKKDTMSPNLTNTSTTGT